MPAQKRLDAAEMAQGRRLLMRRDPVLGGLIKRVGACGIEQRHDPYRALLRSILYQQLAGAAAATIERRFKALFGGRYPLPPALLAADEETLRSAGLSRNKLKAMRSVAEAFGDGGLSNRRLTGLGDDAVVEAVTAVHGVGEWTAHMLLMFSLGRPDVLPVGDYGVRKGAALLYGFADLPRPAELEALAEPWRPYRSVAAWYLWRVLELPSAENVRGSTPLSEQVAARVVANAPKRKTAKANAKTKASAKAKKPVKRTAKN